MANETGDGRSFVLVLRDPSVTKDEREAAAGKLKDVIRRIAVRVCFDPDRTMFADEAVSEVWLRLEGFDDQSPFEPWCSCVVKRILIDRKRRRTRAKEEPLRGDYGGAFEDDSTAAAGIG